MAADDYDPNRWWMGKTYVSDEGDCNPAPRVQPPTTPTKEPDEVCWRCNGTGRVPDQEMRRRHRLYDNEGFPDLGAAHATQPCICATSK